MFTQTVSALNSKNLLTPNISSKKSKVNPKISGLKVDSNTSFTANKEPTILEEIFQAVKKDFDNFIKSIKDSIEDLKKGGDGMEPKEMDDIDDLMRM